MTGARIRNLSRRVDAIAAERGEPRRFVIVTGVPRPDGEPASTIVGNFEIVERASDSRWLKAG